MEELIIFLQQVMQEFTQMSPVSGAILILLGNILIVLLRKLGKLLPLNKQKQLKKLEKQALQIQQKFNKIKEKLENEKRSKTNK